MVLAVVLLVATVATGLMAGVFWIYSNAVMPGLADVDDRTFVGAFQAIDRAIINPVFMAVFAAPVLLTGAASVLLLTSDEQAGLPWVAAAFVLSLVVVVCTGAVNVPMNDALKAEGDPDVIDAAAARGRFDERRWVRWNHLRALASTVSCTCLAWALVQYGTTR